MKWEQDDNDVPLNIEVKKVTIPITKDFLTLHVRGDQHIGVKGIDLEEMKFIYKREQDQHRGNMLILDTGDMIENQSKRSPGHNFDVEITDTNQQLSIAKAMQVELDEHFYGEKKYAKLQESDIRRFGVIGNHEYRDRKETGKWINKDLYSSKGVTDCGIRCIINVTLVHEKTKAKRSYNIYLAHRLTASSESITLATIYKNFCKVKSDIDADIYVCGHYHKKFVASDVKYDNMGKKRRVMYATNPSPIETCEYSAWALFSPIMSSYYTNLYLPVDKNLQMWSKV